MKILCFIAAALILIGATLFTIVLAANGWDFKNFDKAEYETVEHIVTDDFHSVDIVSDTADIRILPSEDGEVKIVSFEPKYEKLSVSVSDGVLKLNSKNDKKWYQHIFSFSIKSPAFTVYLPKAEYAVLAINESTGDVEIAEGFTFGNMDISISTGDMKITSTVNELMKIKVSTGDITLENSTVGSADLKLSTGDLTVNALSVSEGFSHKSSTGKAKITDLTCKNFSSEADTGYITLSNVIASEILSVKRSTGDVNLNGSDGSEILIDTDTGDVKGTILTSKIFIIDTSTGKVNVPESLTGGKCKVITSTGDVKLDVIG